MMGLRVLLIKELREQLRTNRLLAVSAVFLIFGIVSPLTDRYLKQLLDAVGSESAGMSFTVPPAAMILTKPASRAAFLAAKLIAISVTLGIGTILGCGFAYVYVTLLYPTTFALGGYVAMALLLWWMLVGFAAITVLGSSLTRSAIAAAGVGLVALLVLGILAQLPVIGDYMPTSLGTIASHLVTGTDTGFILGPILFNVALVPVLFGITWLTFRRQEL